MVRLTLFMFLVLSLQAYAEDHVYYLSAMHSAIYHEARGEPETGMITVGQVIMNRLNSGKFPHTIHEVINQDKQFSFTSTKVKIQSGKESQKTFIIAIAVITNIYYNDKYKESLFYYACSGKSAVKHKPKWNWKKLKFDGKEGNHCFYSLQEKT